MRKSLFTLAVLFTSALTAMAQPNSVPDVKADATDVYQLWVNGGQNGFFFDSWGGATLSVETIDGKKVEKVDAFKYTGSQFTTFDAYEKQYFHLDVYPMQDMTLGVKMINEKATGGNSPEKGYNITGLKANEWNSIDIPVEYYINKGTSMNKVYQVKLTSSVNENSDENASDADVNADGTGSFYIGNYYFYGKRDLSGETGAELGSVSLDLAIVGPTGTYTINATPLKANGRAFNDDVTYTISDGATLTQNGNQLTVTTTKAGTYTITATSGDATVTTTLTAIDPAPAPTDAASDVLAYYSDTYNATTPGVSEAIWNWKYSKATEITLADNDKAYSVSNAGTFGFNLGAKDITSYTKLHADIYATKAATGHVVWEGGTTGINESNTSFSLKEGWNSVNVDIKGNTGTEATWVQFYIGGPNAADKQNFAIDNVYVTIGDVVVPFDVTIANGVAKVTGSVTVADAEQINNADAMAIDLTNVRSIEDGVKITPKHPNALIFVSGTNPGNVGTPDAKYAAIAGTPNLVVKNTWIYPVQQLQFIDKAGEPQWFGENATSNDIRFLSTGNVGYKVTTTIPAKSYITLYPTNVIPAANIPAGVTAWEAVGYADNTISFNRVGGDMAAFFPYVVYNSNNEDTDISFSGTGDYTIVNWSTGNVAPHAIGDTGAAFQGNFFNEKVTDGTQWILQNNEDGSATFQNANGPKISAFRAYFTGLSTTAPAKAVFNGSTTGINSIQNAEAGSKNSNEIYNVAGQRVSKDYKGLVIKNGKKYINK